jgi:hypothetical protein
MTQSRIPISEFVYDDVSRHFRYLPTGERWKAAGVDAAVGPVMHQGSLIRPSLWLKLRAGVRSWPR